MPRNVAEEQNLLSMQQDDQIRPVEVERLGDRHEVVQQAVAEIGRVVRVDGGFDPSVLGDLHGGGSLRGGKIRIKYRSNSALEGDPASGGEPDRRRTREGPGSGSDRKSGERVPKARTSRREPACVAHCARPSAVPETGASRRLREFRAQKSRMTGRQATNSPSAETDLRANLHSLQQPCPDWRRGRFRATGFLSMWRGGVRTRA